MTQQVNATNMEIEFDEAGSKAGNGPIFTIVMTDDKGERRNLIGGVPAMMVAGLVASGTGLLLHMLTGVSAAQGMQNDAMRAMNARLGALEIRLSQAANDPGQVN